MHFEGSHLDTPHRDGSSALLTAFLGMILQQVSLPSVCNLKVILILFKTEISPVWLLCQGIAGEIIGVLVAELDVWIEMEDAFEIPESFREDSDDRTVLGVSVGADPISNGKIAFNKSVEEGVKDLLFTVPLKDLFGKEAREAFDRFGTLRLGLGIEDTDKFA